MPADSLFRPPIQTPLPESPLSPLPPGPVDTDKENAFLLYAVFCGDIERTAHALSVDPALIKALAEENGWDKKLKPIIDLKASTRSGDVERAVNRALNFVQAHRYRLFLERVLRQLCGMNLTQLQAFLFPQTVDGRSARVTQTFTTRALADVASALEKCHGMTYLALNDTATERKERKEGGDDDATSAEMHLRLAAAMSESGGKSKSTRGILLDAQLQIGQEFASIDIKPPASEALPAGE